MFFMIRRLEEDDEAKRLTRAQRAVYDRIMSVDGAAYIDGKNWLGLEGIIALDDSAREGYQNFIHKLEN